MSSHENFVNGKTEEVMEELKRMEAEQGPLTREQVEDVAEAIIKTAKQPSEPAPMTELEKARAEKQEQKRKEKEEKAAKEYWGTMISRREAYEMFDEGFKIFKQNLTLADIKVATLAKLLVDKGVMTMEEIEEYSKKMVEEVFGPIPEEPKPEGDEVAKTENPE